jgi:WD40 repeat protein
VRVEYLRENMGCGTSRLQSPATGKYSSTNDETSSTHSGHSQSSRSSGFTTSYASGSAKAQASRKKAEAVYRPGASGADADRQFEKWRQKNKNTPAAIASGGFGEKEVEAEFVFGDFKVETQDVQAQRLERFNRVRHNSLTGGIQRKNSISRSHHFVINDFVVKTVDEADEPAFMFAHEIKVPKGFRKLKRFSVRTLTGHSIRVKLVCVSPIEPEFVSATMDDQALGSYSIVTGDETGSYVGHSATIIAASFSRNGLHVATSARDNAVNVWDTKHKDSQKKLIRTLDHTCLPVCLAFSFDATLLVTGCQDKKCRVWDIAANEMDAVFEGHDGVVVCVATHPSVYQAVTGGGDRVLRLWSMHTGEVVKNFFGHDGIVISVNFTPNGERILSNDDRACKMWNVESGACVLNVTLDSLLNLSSLTSDFPPPMPLPKTFIEKMPYSSRQFGYAPNGIVSPLTLSSCRIGSRSVFTLSCLCPGPLSQSYFAVASSSKAIYIVSCITGKEEAMVPTKATVFALAAGSTDELMFGDIFGNIAVVTLEAHNEQTV